MNAVDALRQRPGAWPVSGFTLIEVLVALAVLAVALGAVVSSAAQSVSSVDALRDKTLAQWVALNKAAEYHIAAVWPLPGTTSGDAEMAGRTWKWHATVTNTPVAEIRRLEIRVAAAARPQAYLATVVDFVARY